MIQIDSSFQLKEGVLGCSYSQILTASGGTSSFNWSLQSGRLPSGLSLSPSGVIAGLPDEAGDFELTFEVSDAADNTNSASRLLSLKIYRPGDADGDGLETMGDVTKIERIILGLDPQNAGCDANLDGELNMGDVTKLERIILGLD